MGSMIRWLVSFFLASSLFIANHSHAEVMWVDPESADFEIYDIFLDDGLMLFESSDVYISEGQTLVPFNSIVSALEVNLSYDQVQQRFTGRLNNKDINLSILEAPSNINWNVLLLSRSNQLFVDTQTLAVLLDANVEVSSSELKVTLKPKTNPFPLQVRLDRTNRKVIKQNDNLLDNFSFIIEDQYRLLTTPKGYVNFGLSADDQSNSYNLNVNTYNDILFHSANLSLAKTDGGDLVKRLTMSRETNSPTDTFLGGLTRYAFGDVSSVNNRGATSFSGAGITFSSFENRYTSHFGKITIDEYATANWAAELYRDGFLIATGTVGPDGRIVFEDISVNYGTNRFEIKTYGDFGEQQSIIRDVLIGQNLLKPGEFKYSGGIIDTNHTLFNQTSIFDSEEDYAPSVFFQSEYGLNQSTSLGISLFLKHDLETDSDSQEAIFSVAHQLSNALVDFNFRARENDSYSIDSNIIGSLGRWTSYQFGLEYGNNFNEFGMPETDAQRLGVRANLSGRLGAFAYVVSGRTDNNKQTFGLNTVESRQNQLSGSLSWRYKNINFGNLITAQNFSIVNGVIENSSSTILNEFSVSSALSEFLYLRSSGKFNLSDSDNYFNSIDTNLNWRLSNKLNLNASVEYFKTGDFNLSTYASWQREDYNLTFGTRFSDDDNWQVSLGISVGLDYDYYQNKMNFTNQYSAASGTLDLLTYIDNNKNAVYDEYDEALEGVGFGAAPQWHDTLTNSNGNAYLPGVAVRAPTKLYFDTSQTRAGHLKPIHENFAFYTHPGGITSLDIPFNYNGNIEGNIVFDDSEGGVAIKSIPVEIVDNQNQVIKQVYTSFDDYYVVDNLWPGKYQVKINAEFLNERGLVAVPAFIELELTGEDDFISLEDFLVRAKIETQEESAELVLGNTVLVSDSTISTASENLTLSVLSSIYTIQIGAYSSNQNCLDKISELRRVGIVNTYFMQEKSLCKVYLGQFNERLAADSELQSLRTKGVMQNFVVRIDKPFNAEKNEAVTPQPTERPYAIQLGAFVSNTICDDKLQQVVNLNVPGGRKRIINGLCKVFSGNYTSKQQAESALSALPTSLLKGAFIVRL